MRAWTLLLSGLLIWTAHFFAIYVAASLFPGTSLAKWLTALLTLAALAALLIVLMPLWRRSRQQDGGDELQPWLTSVTLLGGVLAGVAILYQGLPALTA